MLVPAHAPRVRANLPAGLVVLGATGSIGRSTLDVVRAMPGRFQVLGLSAHQRLQDAVALAREFEPRWLVATDPQAAERHDWSALPASTELLVGQDPLPQIVQYDDVDTVMAAIVGRAGLESTWSAIEAGKRVALANKETLVMAGGPVAECAAKSGAELLPVDSEHSAIFQAMLAGGRDAVGRIVLTASGGPFLRAPLERMGEVSVRQALEHPTWKMGPKITVDSATMMNKSLEIIEARWLFDLPADQIAVMVHPQSVVHSLVEFTDGSVLAQLSPPDMKLPIQLALLFPERPCGPAARMNWQETFRLEFEPPDLDRFPGLALGFEVAEAGGTAGAVLNAANEVSVQRFLDGQIGFLDIVRACCDVLRNHDFEPNPNLSRILELDRWARQESTRWKSS